MDRDTTCFVTGPASLLLNLASFLGFSAVALRAMRGTAAAARLCNRVLRPAWLCRSEPSLFQKCLAVHIERAGARSALE